MIDTSRLLFGGAAPHSREDFQNALLRLCSPFADAEGFARQLAAVGYPAAHYSARVEMVSRLLWGLAPLEAGGGSYPGWEWIRAEIVAGTDPDDPGFWGVPGAHDQRVVEAAAMGVALALVAAEKAEADGLQLGSCRPIRPGSGYRTGFNGTD